MKFGSRSLGGAICYVIEDDRAECASGHSPPGWIDDDGIDDQVGIEASIGARGNRDDESAVRQPLRPKDRLGRGNILVAYQERVQKSRVVEHSLDLATPIVVERRYEVNQSIKRPSV